MLVVAGELAGNELDASNLDDAVAIFGRKSGGLGIQNNLAQSCNCRFADWPEKTGQWPGSVNFLGVVDRILWNLHRNVALRQKCLATQARIGLQPPRAV